MKEDRIIDVDGYVHVVDGKILLFDPYMFPLSSEACRAVLFREAGKTPGGNAVRVLEDTGDDSGNYIADTLDAADFPDPVQNRIRATLAAIQKGDGSAT